MYIVYAFNVGNLVFTRVGTFSTKREANAARQRIATSALTSKDPIVPKMYDINGKLLKDGW